jgi:endo-1,4-beta-xylanase
MRIFVLIKTYLVLIAMLFVFPNIYGQDIPVTVQAESGTLGGDFRLIDTLGATAVTIKTDVVNTLNPGNTKRVITFQLTFPDSGTYDLYARILVGPNGYDDDSYFYGNGFGSKNVATDGDWIRANGIASGGYSSSTAVVDGSGSAQTLVWKWINMSKYKGDAIPVNFRVERSALTQTFQIGGRETGLYFDKFVFGRSGLYFTVSNLNNGEAGSKEYPVNKPLGTPLAKGKSKFLGCEWDYIQAPSFAGYWNQLTPGNAGKWGSVESSRDVMNWTVLDSTFKVANKYKIPIKEHTLIWGAQQPSWINGLDATTQRKEIEQWFSALAARYDSFASIDVVNEPLHNAPNGMIPWGTTTPNVNYANALGGAGVTGWDWVITSFRLARQYFPKSKLILNDYNIINSTTNTDKYIEIINLLKAENLIDGIGEQAHAFTTYGVSVSTLKENLDALAATGIPLYLTEMDVDGATDLIQLQEFRRIFPLFWEHPAIKGITLWGFRYGVWRNDQGAYLITEDDKERPALTWLKAYVNDTVTNAQSIIVSSVNDSSSIRTAKGKLNLIATFFPINTTIRNVTWSVSPANIATIDSTGLLTAVANGKATITATAWDGSGTKGTMEVTIFNQTSGLSDLLSDEKISVFPNPVTNGYFTIEGMNGITRIELMDLLGKKLIEWNNLKQSAINIAINIKSGVYTLKLCKGQQSVIKKIVVR